MTKFNDLLFENATLRAAYDSTQAETTALKAAVDALTKKIDEQQQVFSVTPSPSLTASSSAMEEMTMNLGLTTPPTTRGERRGGAARRLRKKEGEGERGEEKRGRAGPGASKGKESGDTSGGVERGEESGGAGGKMFKNGRGTVEEMGDRPGEVASERTGLLGSDDAR
ncbi:hypothetical protein BZA77DRAFT_360857 [Pyronema omphalodes]|nr:hypothetical protein BZA77DRAFT_360857 [Pyronema omphalodes]